MVADANARLGKTTAPTDHDLVSYLRLMDASHDNRVSLEEYELFVLKALRSRGLRL